MSYFQSCDFRSTKSCKDYFMQLYVAGVFLNGIAVPGTLLMFHPGTVVRTFNIIMILIVINNIYLTLQCTFYMYF